MEFSSPRLIIDPKHYGLRQVDDQGTLRFALFHHRESVGGMHSPYPYLQSGLTLIYNLNHPSMPVTLKTTPNAVRHSCGAIKSIELLMPSYIQVKVDSPAVYFLHSESVMLLEYSSEHGSGFKVFNQALGQ